MADARPLGCSFDVKFHAQRSQRERGRARPGHSIASLTEVDVLQRKSIRRDRERVPSRVAEERRERRPYPSSASPPRREQSSRTLSHAPADPSRSVGLPTKPSTPLSSGSRWMCWRGVVGARQTRRRTRSSSYWKAARSAMRVGSPAAARSKSLRIAGWIPCSDHTIKAPATSNFYLNIETRVQSAPRPGVASVLIRAGVRRRQARLRRDRSRATSLDRLCQSQPLPQRGGSSSSLCNPSLPVCPSYRTYSSVRRCTGSSPLTCHSLPG